MARAATAMCVCVAQGIVAALKLPWTPLQQKLLARALPMPTHRFDIIMKNLEGASAGSVHPGDWRFKDFDYE